MLSRKNIIYLFFILIFTSLTLEIGARYYLTHIINKTTCRKFQFNSYRVYEHIPNYKIIHKDGKRITINSNGFRRDNDIKQRKPEDTFRVFLLGGSAAHGISSTRPYPIRHIDQNETIDSYIESKLKKKYPNKNIEIINAAVTGYQVFQHTQYILAELLDYGPDLIIFFDGANDHYQINYETSYYNDFLYQFWKSRLQNPSIEGTFDYISLWLSEYSGLFRGFLEYKKQNDAYKIDKFNHRNNVNYINSSTDSLRILFNKYAQKGFLRSIKTNLTLLKENNIKAILCLQPMLVLRDSSLLSEEEKQFSQPQQSVNKLYPFVVDELEKISNEYNVDFINYIPVFNNNLYLSQQLFIDYCHLTPLGGEIVANSLLPYVENILLNQENN